jgi:hypothetical protein
MGSRPFRQTLNLGVLEDEYRIVRKGKKTQGPVSLGP